MATVASRTYPHRVLRSINTPDYPIADWIINPDLRAVLSQPNKYWILNGDIFSLMDQAARDAVDAALEQARTDQERAESKDQVEDDRLIKALAIVLSADFGSGLTAREIMDRIKAEIDNN